MTSNYDQFFGKWELIKIVPDARHPFDPSASGFAFCLWKAAKWITAIVYENPSDGYRSSAEDPIIWPDTPDGGTSVYVPVLVSALTGDYACDGLEMRDRRNGKIILRLGTENTDDYYPWFCAEWTPENIEQSE